MVKKFVKKPVQIEALQYTGNNFDELQAFCGEYLSGVLVYNKPIRILTLEGPIYGQVGDWIIRGVKGEYYPCKPDIFEQTYSEVV
jgi:hypothetical protein